METFGEWLRGQRTSRKLTRHEFAGRVGCSVALLRKIENGERRPSTQIAELIANCLDVPLKERSTFVRVARGELRVDRISPEPKPVAIPSVFSPKTNLPAFPTPLIGRQDEVEQLSQLLSNPQCRLLTLIGPGGIGKTRLAIETASTMQDFFIDGVYFVPLASVHSTRLIVPVIADSVGFTFHHASHTDPKTQLFSYLKEKQALLLTDNLEQLLIEPGIELLAELLEHAPHMKLLATSRECLSLQEEWVYEVQGLPVPESIDAEERGQNTSVELFVQRGRRAHVNYNFTMHDFPAIVRISQLVEGNPLGIELAAAWVRALPCNEIAHEIERGMSFLSISARDLPVRHRSMRAVFDHSWKLLSESERRVLLRLSVFRGGFKREAAEQVTEATLNIISALISKSLVRRSSIGRYDLHELIRQFAAEQLAGQPEEESTTQARHSKYYLTYFGQAAGRLGSSAQQETLADLTAEMDNFRAAWDWSITDGEFAWIEQTLSTFWLLYDARGWFHEGLDALSRAETALEAAHGHSPPERRDQLALGHLLATRAWFSYRFADYEQAQKMLERCLEILRPLNELRVLIEPIMYLGQIMEVTGNYTRALELYSEGLEISTAIGERWFATLFLTDLNGFIAVTHATGNPENAHEGLRSSVADWRLIGDPRFTAFGLRLLSHSTLALERYDEARAVLEESAALNQSIGDRWGLGTTYRGLGVVAQAFGQHEEAVNMFRESLDILSELGGNWWVARVLADMSRSVFALGNPSEARRIWHESLRIATEIHATPVVLEALASFASLQAEPEDRERALELLLVVLNHPASFQETKNRADRRRAELEAYFTPSQIEAIQAHAAEKTFEAVVEALLN